MIVTLLHSSPQEDSKKVTNYANRLNLYHWSSYTLS